MGLLLHAYDPVGAASLFANSAAQGAARQQQALEFLARLARETSHDHQLSVENQRRLDFEKSKEGEHAREFDVQHRPWNPPALDTTSPTDTGLPGLDPTDTVQPDSSPDGVNLYNTGGPQPISKPLVPMPETSAFMSIPGADVAPDTADVPVTLPPAQMRLQPPDLAAVSAQQTGGTGSAFGPVDPYAPPQFGAPGQLDGGEAVPNQARADAQAASFAADRKTPLAPPALPAKAVDGVKEDVAKLGELFRGMPENFVVPTLTHFASQRVLQEARTTAKAAETSIAEMTKDMTFDQATNTYANADGAKFFVGTSRGKPVLTPWKPETVKAKRTFLGSDGKPYSIGSDGQPIQPVPEGVQLMEGKLPPARTLPDGSLGIVNPDHSVTTLIPATIKLGDKAKADYLKALNDAHVALSDLNATEMQYQGKPGAFKDWYGITDKTVKEKRDSFDAAQQKVLDMQTLYPALKIANPTTSAPAAAPGAGAPTAAGATGATKQIDAATAKKFLEQAGGDKEKARALAREAGYGF